jgi:hypothetical protein
MIGFIGTSLQLQLTQWTLLRDVCLTNLSRTSDELSFPEFESESESEPYLTVDGQSASLSWNVGPIWRLRS